MIPHRPTKPSCDNCRRSKKQTKGIRVRSRDADRRRIHLHHEQLEDRSLLSVNLLGSFDAMTIDSNTGGGTQTPPDPNGAASDATYIETVKQQVSVYTKATGAMLATDNLDHFFITTGGLAPADAASSLLDPEMTYDDQIGRFIVSEMDYDFGPGHVSAFDFAVSKSSDPATLTAADWNFYQINTSENDGTASGTFDADFVGNVGWNHDAFVFTLNMFAADGSTAHVQVNSVNNSDLLNGVSQANLHDYRNDNYDSLFLRPTVMHDSKSGDPMWFVDQFDGKTHIQVFKMTNVLSSSATFTGTELLVNPYTDIHQSGVYPKQPNGTTVTTIQDSRFENVAEDNNLLVASQAVNVSPTENDARWYEIDVTSGAPVLKDQGSVSGGNNTYLYSPAVDINAAGDIGMTYIRSGTDTTSDYMSMWIAGRAPTDAAGTTQTPQLVKAGAANYSDTNSNGSQAGIFSGISTDSDGSFYAVNEYATNRASGNWGTEVAHFSVGGSTSAPSVVYVNSAWSTFATGQAITDADPVAAGNQGAVFGTNAFATIGAALKAVAAGGTVYVNSGDYTSEAVSLGSGDTLSLVGTGPSLPGTVKIGSLAGSAGTTIDTGSDGSLANVLQVGALGTATVEAGLVTGPGSLTLQGGALTLSNASNSYSAGTTVSGGTLLVDGASGSGSVTVGNGATVGGIGTIAGSLIVNAGGTVSPGDPTSSTGILATGQVTLLGGYTAQINGATSAGTSYDQLNLSGSATLVGGNLSISLGYAPSAGDSIALLSATGIVTGPVSINGSLVNEGGHVTLTFGGLSYTFKVSYAGDKLTLALDQNPTINVDSFGTGTSNTISVSTSAGSTIVTVNGTTVFSLPNVDLTGLTLDSPTGNDTFNVSAVSVPTTINGGTGNDTFNVTGPIAASLTIAGQSSANTLNFNAGTQPVTVSANAISQTNASSLAYSGIANLNIMNDGGVTLVGADNSANAITVARDLNDKTLNDITLTGGPAITIATASSLSISGGGGTASNQLTINEDSNGLPVFATAAAGAHTNTAFSGSSPTPANIGISFSGGGSGGNSLVINLTSAHSVTDYSDNVTAAGSGVAAIASGINVSFGGLTTLAINGSGGTLAVSDAANSKVTSLTVSDPNPGSGQTLVTGNSNWAAVTLDGFGSLAVQGTNANNNTITLGSLDATGVNGHSLTNVTLQGGSGNDIISVNSLPSGVTATLLGGNGSNRFNLDSSGGGHDLAAIAGTVTVSPAGDSTTASDTLSINDSGHSGSRTVTIAQTKITGITGSGTSAVNYDGSGRIRTVNITADGSGNEFDIQSTNGSATNGYTINTGSGADTINISSDAPADTGTLANILSPVFLNTQGGGDSLAISDAASASANYTLAGGATAGSTTLTTTDSAAITYDANGTSGQLASFILTGSAAGNDDFTVSASALSATTAVSLSANSSSAGNTLNVAGDGSAAVTLDLGAQSVTEAGFEPISFSGMATVNVNAAGATINLVGNTTDDRLVVTPTSATSATIQDNGSGPVFNFSGAASMLVDLSGGTNTLVINGSAGSDRITATANASGNPSVTVAQGAGVDVPIAYVAADLSALDINAMAGDDTLTVDSSAGPPTTPIVYDGGTGNNSVSLVDSVHTNVSGIYTPGPAAGQGSESLNFGTAVNPVLENIQFSNTAAVSDSVPGVVSVLGTAGNDTIDYGEGNDATGKPNAAWGQVTVDSLPAFSFSNKSGLTINAGAGSDTVNIDDASTPSNLTGITINGNASASDTLNFTGSGAGAITLSLQADRATEAGFAPVSFSGMATVNVNAAGAAINLVGNTTDDRLAVTPTDATSATIQDNDSGPVFDLSDAASLLADLSGGTNTLVVNGTAGNDQITAKTNASGNPSVTVAQGADVGLSIAYVAADLTALDINALAGDDTFTVDSSSGPLTTPIVYDGGTGNNSVSLVDSVHTNVSGIYTPGPAAGQGSESLNFGTAVNPVLENIQFSNTAAVADSVPGVVTVLGTAGNDTIAYGEGNDATGKPNAAWGQVTVDGLPAFNFSNKTGLTINMGAGSDTVNIDDAATPSNLTGITINGNASASDTLNFTGSGAGAITLSLQADTVTETGFAPINFSGIGTVNVNAAGAAINVVGTTADDNLAVTPTGASSATAQDNGSGPVFNFSGAASLGVDLSGGTNTLVINGSAGNDQITAQTTASGSPSVTVSQGAILDLPVAYVAANLAALDINGLAGDDTLTVDSSHGALTTPIAFNGGTGNNAVSLLDTTHANVSAVYAPGPAAAQGTDTLSFGTTANPVLETVQFSNANSVYDNVPGPLTMLGTAGDDTINYGEGNDTSGKPNTAWGQVAVDSLPAINFSNKSSLTVSTGAGSDTVNINDAAAPADLAGITINGGASASDTLEFTGSGAGGITLDPQADTVTEAGFAPVSFSGIGTVNVNAAAAAVRVVGTSGDDNLVVTPTGAKSATLQDNDTGPAFGLSEASSITTDLAGGNNTLTVIGSGGGSLTVDVQSSTLSQSGFVPVQFAGFGTVDVNAAGAPLSIIGAVSGGSLSVTPTGAGTAIVQEDGGTTFNFSGATSLLVDLSGGNNTVVINASGNSDQITAQTNASSNPAVTISQPGTADLPISYVAADISALDINGLGGNDTLTLDSSHGAVTTPVVFDGGDGSNSVSVIDTVHTGVSDVYAAGPLAGQGGDTLNFGTSANPLQQTVRFSNVAAVYDSVPGTLTALGTPAGDTIDYIDGNDATGKPNAAWGQVTVNSLQAFNFTDKTSLTINSGSGSDSIDVNDPSLPGSLTGINVHGSDPAGNVTLTYHAVAGASNLVVIAPTGQGSGTLTNAGPSQPTIVFADVAALNVVAQATGAGQELIYTGTAGNDTFELTPGATGDSGKIVGSEAGTGGFAFVPVAFTGFGSGTASIVLGSAFGHGAVGGADTAIVDGATSSDSIAIQPSSLISNANAVSETIAGVAHADVVVDPTMGFSKVILKSEGGTDSISTSMPSAQPSIAYVIQGSTSGGTTTLNYTAPTGGATTIDLAGGTITAAGANTVTFTGLAALNLNAHSGALTIVDGNAGAILSATPTGATSGTAQIKGALTILTFSATSAANIDFPQGGQVDVSTAGTAATFIADESKRTIAVLTSDGSALIPFTVLANVGTVELDGGTGNTTFIVVPAAGSLAAGTTDIVGEADFAPPTNLLVNVVGGGPAAANTLVIANYDAATGKTSALDTSLIAVNDPATTASGVVHVFHNNGGGSGPNQYPDINYSDVGAVNLNTPLLGDGLSTATAANWVTDLYEQLLKREPSPTELVYWMNQLQAGIAPQVLAKVFVTSNEYRAAQITVLYEKYLDREPDAGGLTYWTGVWSAAGGPKPVQAGIIGSPEFYATAGKLYPKLSPDAAWVTALYQDLLGRPPEADGLNAWVSFIQDNSRESVVLGFVTSAEFRSIMVNDLFTMYLGRPADPNTQQIFVQAMQSGMTQDKVLTIIVASDEYIHKAR